MLSDILQKLSQEPDCIVGLLELYGCGKIKLNAREIRFARDDSPSSGMNISIRLENNDAVFVHDFARSESNNIVSWLCKEKNVQFRDVLTDLKKILKLDNNWRPQNRQRGLFGGVFDGIIHRTDPPIKTYDESILDQYKKIGNERFLKDNISLKVQREFDIGYDTETSRITIPIRDSNGSIIGIKGRRNYHTDDEFDPKYLYLTPCRMSSTLYGFSNNYQHLYGNIILIGEAEKFVLQAASYGYRNAVALGSNSLSETQAKLLLSLRPQAVYWCMDEGLDKANTLRNFKLLRDVCTMMDVPQYWWNYDNDLDIEVGSKVSPTDMGKEKFEEIINTEMELLKD